MSVPRIDSHRREKPCLDVGGTTMLNYTTNNFDVSYRLMTIGRMRQAFENGSCCHYHGHHRNHHHSTHASVKPSCEMERQIYLHMWRRPSKINPINMQSCLSPPAEIFIESMRSICANLDLRGKRRWCMIKFMLVGVFFIWVIFLELYLTFDDFHLPAEPSRGFHQICLASGSA